MSDWQSSDARRKSIMESSFNNPYDSLLFLLYRSIFSSSHYRLVTTTRNNKLAIWISKHPTKSIPSVGWKVNYYHIKLWQGEKTLLSIAIPSPSPRQSRISSLASSRPLCARIVLTVCSLRTMNGRKLFSWVSIYSN